MKRALYAVAAVLVIALIVWVARNTYWDDVKIPIPLKGEAVTNPFYAVQRFTQAVGGHAARDRTWLSPPTNAVVVLSSWHWDLTADRRQTIERWVEAGGRLVVDSTLGGNLDTFERWSGISREFDIDRFLEQQKKNEDELEVEFDQSTIEEVGQTACGQFNEERRGETSPGVSRRICGFRGFQFLDAKTRPDWVLRNEHGAQVIRVSVGRGSVTFVNATPFVHRSLFDADHGWLFVSATQFTRGDDVRFMSEAEYPSLLTLMWQHGGPAVALMLVVIALLVWRGWVRFGPLAPPLPSARRSLAEQIRGSGQFALRYGSGDSLHGAVVRALNEAVSRRVPGYAKLPPQEQTAALARLTGFDGGSLAAALHHLASRRADRLRNALALLETARRRAVSQHPRSSDGTD